MDITLSHADIRRALESAYGECRTVSGGKNADISLIFPTSIRIFSE